MTSKTGGTESESGRYLALRRELVMLEAEMQRAADTLPHDSAFDKAEIEIRLWANRVRDLVSRFPVTSDEVGG